MKKHEILGLILAVLIIIATYTLNNSFHVIRAFSGEYTDSAISLQSNAFKRQADSDQPLLTSTLKQSYFRYELVDIIADYRDENNNTMRHATIKARIYHNNKIITTIGEMKEIHLRFDKESGLWIGRWPIPWNPQLGTYEVLVSAQPNTPGPAHTARSSFIIKGRTPPPVEPGFCVSMLERNSSIVDRSIIGPDGTKGDWRNVIAWAKYMDADALFQLVAITHGPGPNSKTRPFDESKFEESKLFAAKSQKENLLYGGWAQCFFSQNKGFEKLGYQASLGFNQKTGTLYESYHISLKDKKRYNDLLSFTRRMDANPNVSFIGYDYVRTGHVDGYELVDDFVADMSIDIPAAWSKMQKKQRILWFARRIENDNDQNLIDKWRWWRAHTSASMIAWLIEESGTQKPVWLFTLGWEHGKQHGQDPLMFFDAGVTYDAVMLYEANQQQFRSLLVDWKGYVSSEQVNLLCGNSVDIKLLDSVYMSPVDELVRRNTVGSRKLSFGGPVDGIFWHDFTRAFWGRKGEYSTREWVLAGAKSFSEYRRDVGKNPIRTHIDAPANAGLHKKITIPVSVENISLDPINNFAITVEPTDGIAIHSAKAVKIESLGPGETKTVHFTISLSNAQRYHYMFAVKAHIPGNKQSTDFAIIRRKIYVSTSIQTTSDSSHTDL